MRTLAAFTLLLLAGCTSSIGQEGSDRGTEEDAAQRTEAYAPAGVSVDIPPGMDAEAAALQVCWEGDCRPVDVVLAPATEVDESSCEDTVPEGACSARVRKTGGFYGFAGISDLPESPVRVTLTVVDGAGKELVHHTLEATPQPVYPNGPTGDVAGPQLGLEVAADGSVTTRR
ncbi:hypothetical protein [Saccharomonospora sp.]|uniref:hypothetical protein n=1 Tax=Saccharomonospora sp. TaxID=33913 RepID=UPI00263067B1|nr:hypothetical protein [Saccharomonospora sp.]